MVNQQIKVAVDAIVFGYSDCTLYILLIKQKFGKLKGTWVLPGGFVKDDESLSNAVIRELNEEAGIEVGYLEQLYTFGDDIKRDHRARVISVAYFALVNQQKLSLIASSDALEAEWFPIHKLPDLGFDHSFIIEVAWKRLKAKISYQPIGFDLLDREFLFADLENLYTAILEKAIDRRNFRKKILSFGILDETDKIAFQKAGRPARLFRFNKKNYNKILKEGFSFEIRFA
jgi:8-oxo-dGTP diphosphatase